MATRRATTPEPEQVFMTAEELEQQRESRRLQLLESDTDEPEDRVKKMLADLRSDQNAKIRLYRRNGNNLSICQDYSLDDFESANFADIVRARWGAGKYDVKLYGSKGVITAVTLSIQEPVTPLHVAPVANNGSDALAQVLANMAQQQQMILEVLTRQQNPAPAVNPMDQMTQMLTMMKLMKEATAAPPVAPPSSITEIMSAIREMKAVAKEINPEPEDKEPSMMQMAGQVLPLLRDAIQGQQAPQIQPVALPATFAESAPQEIPQTNPIESDDDVNAIQKMQLAALLQKLIKFAESKVPPEAGAELVLDKAPDAVLDFLEMDDWWTALSGAAPQVIPHQEFFAAVRAKVLESLTDEDEPPAPGQAPASSQG